MPRTVRGGQWLRSYIQVRTAAGTHTAHAAVVLERAAANLITTGYHTEPNRMASGWQHPVQ